LVVVAVHSAALRVTRYDVGRGKFAFV